MLSQGFILAFPSVEILFPRYPHDLLFHPFHVFAQICLLSEIVPNYPIKIFKKEMYISLYTVLVFFPQYFLHLIYQII
jgi:hypothetical protein